MRIDEYGLSQVYANVMVPEHDDWDTMKDDLEASTVKLANAVTKSGKMTLDVTEARKALGEILAVHGNRLQKISPTPIRIDIMEIDLQPALVVMPYEKSMTGYWPMDSWYMEAKAPIDGAVINLEA